MEGTKKDIYKKKYSKEELLKKIKIYIFSLFGIIVFFIPLKINNQYEILIYHISYFIENESSSIIDISIIFFTLLSISKNILNTQKTIKRKFLICVKVFSLIILISIITKKENIFFINDNLIFILRHLMLELSIVLPISSLFMPFLLDYGLLEITESFTHKIMKKMFKVSGKVFLNFLVYLLVNNICGIFVTYKLYKDGKLREKETYITILNFSILSLTLTRDLCNKINIKTMKLFLMEMIVLVICNFIICRIYPLRNKKQSYYFKSNHKNVNCRRNKINTAVKRYYENKSNKNIFTLSISYLNDVIDVLMDLIPIVVFIFFFVDIIYSIPFIYDIINNFTDIFISLFNIPSTKAISNIINLNTFSPILAIENIEKDSYYISKIMMGMFISLQCTSICLLIPFIESSIIDLRFRDILLVAFERFIIILFFCFFIYNFYLGYTI